MLQSKSRYKFDRCRLLGGMSKKTSIVLKFDYDCVIYVNDMDPSFEKILEEWETIIAMGMNQIAGETKVTAYSIQFEVDGFQFDIILVSLNIWQLKQDRKKRYCVHFVVFLNRLTEYQQIDIIFLNFYDHKLVSTCDKPYLMDPTNPYNNIFANLPHRFLPILATRSKEMLQRLGKCETNSVGEFEKLCDSQPDLHSLFRSQMNRNRIDTIMGVSQNCNEKSKRLIVRRNTFHSKILENIKNLMNFLRKYIVTIVHNKSEEDIEENTKQVAERFLNRLLYKEDHHQWVTTDKKQEDCDITFIFLLNTAKTDVLYISMTQ
ncbi:unnamed protein product [Rotaria socialis]|nr:unnamed protein product [Rotaria socialis]